MNIRLLILGKSADTITVDTGANVHDVLDHANTTLEGRSVTLNGVGCDLSAPLHEGDILSLVPKVMGG